ncbi:hypothetical protein CNMCM5793_005465 [Aspergillus hiratsukae]|uniref:Uncharacterized protein n=1 Tax=Aspergillus hiratsukae TaxID=1194566 RepID=A0A8H6QFV1_9EURO|nr:hypothetical protein CNMCM5793_005465 [Aspergillus hiratsukae]KAF7171497.1 hypothetical protein CNMCM6106_005872 [Aspergillus hiratsukae]
MRFQISLLTLLYVILFASLSHAFIGPTCMKIPDALGDKPDKIYKQFYTQICEKGCKPNLSHFNKWARKHVVQPVIAQTMKEVGLPRHTQRLVDLADEVGRVTKQECVKELGGSHLCQDPTKFEAFGACLKGNLLPVLLTKAPEFMDLLAEPACQRISDYLAKPDLWEKVIPKYIANYSKGEWPPVATRYHEVPATRWDADGLSGSAWHMFDAAKENDEKVGDGDCQILWKKE